MNEDKSRISNKFNWYDRKVRIIEEYYNSLNILFNLIKNKYESKLKDDQL